MFALLPFPLIHDDTNRSKRAQRCPPPRPRRAPPLHLSNRTSSFVFSGHGECLEHGYVLNSRYQVVYPFPTFQPAFQLKKDQVILLNTSYSLVACGISLCPGKIHMQQKSCSSIMTAFVTPTTNYIYTTRGRGLAVAADATPASI